MPKHKTKGPLTLQGAALPKQAFRSDVSLSLKVLHRDSAAAGRGLSALVHPSSIQQLLLQDQQTTPAAQSAPEADSSCFLQLASGSDCVLHTRASGEVAPGCILVDEVQQANLRLCAGEVYGFSVFVPGSQPGGVEAAAAAGDSEDEAPSDADMQQADVDTAASGSAGRVGTDSDPDDTPHQQQQQQVPFELTDMDVEVRLLPGASSSSDGGVFKVDAEALTRAFCRQCFGRVLAVNEFVVVDLPGCPPLLLRVLVTNTLTAEEQQEALAYHCFRGLLTPDTQVYLATASQQPSSSSSTAQTTSQQQHTAHTAGASLAAAAADDTSQQFSSLTLQPPADPAAHSLNNDHNNNHRQQQQQQHERHVQAMNGSMNGSINGSHAGSAHTAQQQQQQQQQGGSTEHPPPVQSRLLGVCGGCSLQLLGARPRPPAAAPTNIVNVYTSDGEHFPVKKTLLRPCIALTKVVRDSGDTAPCVAVDVDTLTFDRVLIFLEAYALRRPPPRYAVHLLGDLQEAGTKLGLRPLQEYCTKLLGDKQAALSMYTYADVQRANASGKVWLILDGMVLDVGRWLPEHPGGAAIIPKQSLNLDCARFFEMYHASRESFLYIAEFYVGELVPSERSDVPMGGAQPPSQDFLQQLREFTPWRQAMQQQALARSREATTFKSF